MKRYDKFGEREYEHRLKDRIYRELPEGDIQVFKDIDPEIVLLEQSQNSYYVYLTLDLYRRLEYVFKRRMSLMAALAYCDITKSKWEKLCKKYVHLKERVDVWKGFMEAKASERVAQAIIDDGDLDTSKWALERLNKADFGKRVDINVGGEVTHAIEMNIDKVREIRRLIMGEVVDVDAEVLPNGSEQKALNG